MKIAMGSDHGGIHLKNHLKDYLELKGYEVIDKGTYTEESCDYPDYAAKVGHAVTGGEADLGILVCGTGLGISIAANKIKGVRAAVCGDKNEPRAQQRQYSGFGRARNRCWPCRNDCRCLAAYRICRRTP